MMRGTIFMDYTGSLPEDFIATIKELKNPLVRKTRPLILSDETDVDGLLNLILGMLRTCDARVWSIEVKRDVPDEDIWVGETLIAAS